MGTGRGSGSDTGSGRERRGRPTVRGEQRGGPGLRAGIVPGPCPAPSGASRLWDSPGGHRAPLPASCRSGIRPCPALLLHRRCSQRHPVLRALLSVPSMWNSHLRWPEEVPAQGPRWGGSSLPQRGFRCPPVSRGCVGASVAPCAGAGRAAHGQGSAHAAGPALAPSFCRAFPPGPAPSAASPGRCWGQVEISLASVGLGFRSFPGAFWWLVCSERRFQLWLSQTWKEKLRG